MTSQRSESALEDERSAHEACRRLPPDPDINAKEVHFLHSATIDPVGVQFGLILYAVVSVFLHFSNIDRTEGWVTLGDHQFKDWSHLSWLVRTFAFCFLEWLTALVEQDGCPSKFRVNVSSASANIVYATGLFSTMVLSMDIMATVRYLIIEFWRLEIMIVVHPSIYPDIVLDLFWWYFMINLLVAAHYALKWRIYIYFLSPLEGFIRVMKDQMRKERALERAAKMSTEKSGIASDNLSPYANSVINADGLEPRRDRTAEPRKGIKPLRSSIILYLGIWLAILHYTWPNVDLSENTSIFIYSAHILPRWLATTFSAYALP